MPTRNVDHAPSTDGAQAAQQQLFGEVRPPVLAAWGAGVDSTAMLIELIERGETVDHVLFADTGGERPETYAFIPIFRAWLTARGVPSALVQYSASNFKNWPAYRTLEENCLTNGTLPSMAFGFGSCSQKWKIAPQNRWTEAWAPAREIWAAGGKVIKLIGYDCSAADSRRYAEREGYTDPRYVYRYPLREWGWTRERCIERIAQANLPVPCKSACFYCPATKPRELHTLSAPLLRRIVLMEARAKPRLRDIDGLWRKPVKGLRGATARPGSMTQYIREQGLLSAEEIERIIALAPASLTRWQESVMLQWTSRPELRQWLALFDAVAAEGMCAPPTPPLYAPLRARSQPIGAASARCVTEDAGVPEPAPTLQRSCSLESGEVGRSGSRSSTAIRTP